MGWACMRKTVILCVIYFYVAVLTACTGNGGNTNTTGDTGTKTEAVLPSESSEADARETELPFDPDLPTQYSADGVSSDC